VITDLPTFYVREIIMGTQISFKYLSSSNPYLTGALCLRFPFLVKSLVKKIINTLHLLEIVNYLVMTCRQRQQTTQ